LIAIIPIVVINILIQNYSLRKNLKDSEEISAKLVDREAGSKPVAERESNVVLTSDNEKDRYEFPPENILYISSEGNYAKVFIVKERIENILIRSSLKRVEKQLGNFPELFRCHRAYIVNIGRIEKTTGNAQGLRLTLKNAEKTIPVSRSFVKEFKNRVGLS
jgi:DNA-binding LytR/AlgR family response regulator